jgi:hypothetical protein
LSDNLLKRAYQGAIDSFGKAAQQNRAVRKPILLRTDAG